MYPSSFIHSPVEERLDLFLIFGDNKVSINMHVLCVHVCAHNFLLLYDKYPRVGLGHIASAYIDFLNNFYDLSLLLDFDPISILFLF